MHVSSGVSDGHVSSRMCVMNGGDHRRSGLRGPARGGWGTVGVGYSDRGNSAWVQRMQAAVHPEGSRELTAACRKPGYITAPYRTVPYCVLCKTSRHVSRSSMFHTCTKNRRADNSMQETTGVEHNSTEWEGGKDRGPAKRNKLRTCTGHPPAEPWH